MTQGKLRPHLDVRLPISPSAALARYQALSAEENYNALAMRGIGRKIDWIAGEQSNPLGLAAVPGFARFYEPEDGVDFLFQSLHFACLVIERYSEEGQIYIKELDYDVKEVDLLFRFWSKDGGLPTGLGPIAGYDISVENVPKALSLFRDEKRPRAAREVLERIGCNILWGAPNPPELAILAWQILKGEVSLPRPPIRPPTEVHRDTLLAVLSEEIQARARYPLGANAAKLLHGSMPPICGAVVGAAALTACGFPVNARQAVSIVNERKKTSIGRRSTWGAKDMDCKRICFVWFAAER